MTTKNRLYKRAAPQSCVPRYIWHVGEGLAFFAGPLGRNALHSHSTAVFLAGLHGKFRLRIEAGDWQSCRSAVIPAGVSYEFDLSNNPLSVLYLEPNIAGVDALVPLARDTREINHTLVGDNGEVSLLRDLYEGNANEESICEALQDLVGFSKRQARKEIDGRVIRIVEALQTNFLNPAPATELARSVGLSDSRLQHLFTREVGVPLRRYRTWNRLRAAIREIAQGNTYTNAAHAAGFYDQSHFAREFRRTFGAPASRGLTRRRK